MPQYIMPGKTPEFFELDAFTQGYVEAALWTDCSTDCEELTDKDFTDLAPETLAKMVADCEIFQKQNAYILQKEIERNPNPFRPLSPRAAGHDFWLTRNRHGAGFWDGDWPHYGDTLTEMCKAFPEVSLYLGDDGRIYA